MVNESDILNALKQINDPDLHKDIVSLGFVKNVKSCDGIVSFTIELTTPACPVRDQMKLAATEIVGKLPGVKTVNVQMTAQVRPTLSEQKQKLIPLVKNIVPIASGKGGVGKSTVSANIALALHKMGAKVGLMDADVYGPSIPTIMGVKQLPKHVDGKMIPPVMYGIKIVSMGFFVPAGDAVIWRGPMLHKTMEQFLGVVDWGELDYLIVDLPPGTGDVQLSLCQMIPLTGAAVVSTPQDVALKVAEKAVIMFDKLRTPILGVIENMSGFVCSHCGNREEIFGSGGAKRYCMERDIPFLGEIPLSTNIRTTSDYGHPIVQSDPDSPAAKAFFKIAESLASQVSIKTMGGSSNKPEPLEISRVEPDRIRIKWKDGHESNYLGYQLRRACGCAQCVDEMSGKPLLDPKSVPENVHAITMNPVGRYAVHFQWSDNHTSGIYTFDRLRKLCLCNLCKPG